MSLTPTKPWFPFVFIVLAVLGFSDATWLAIKHFTQTIVPCSLTHGCELVTTSQYSLILGIPVALLGSLYYFTLIFGTIISLESKKERIFRLITRFSLAGFLMSLWFLFAQIFLIHAICQWCLGSAITSTLLFVLSYFFYPKAATKVVSEPEVL